MVCNKCIVPGCKSGTKAEKEKCKKEGKKACSMFHPPRDVELFEKWKRALPKLNSDLTEGSCVCELHFLPDELERFYVTKLHDGSINKIERGKILLKHGSIPSIFSHLPDPVTKRKLPLVKHTKKMKTESTVVVDITENKENIPMNTMKECFTFSKLCENILLIKKPNHLWTVGHTDNFIIYARWNDDFNLEKRIVIESNLKVRVFLRALELDVMDNMVFVCIEDISTLLEKVESFKICEGASDKSNVRCRVCLPVRTQAKGRIRRWCNHCQIVRKRERNALRICNVKKTVIGHMKLRQRLTDARKRCSRLKKKTPDGVVNLKFWEAVLAIDNPQSYSLKVCPKLKASHLQPKYYEKMNVAMAFQFFSNSVACGMEIFRDHHADLEESNGCVNFIRRLNNLADAMNSKTPKDALKLNSPAHKSIETFLQFLYEWESYAKEKDTNFISESTCYGLKVTLKASLQIMEFLTAKCNYEYLMTARLTQDALERFFSMMRNACGSNDHPDAIMFIQVFRLLGTYSLVKPMKGCNITGGEMISTLIKCNEIYDPESLQENFNKKLDALLSCGSDIHIFDDHSYTQQSSADGVVEYLAGYVAHRGRNFTKCLVCRAYLFAEENEESSPSASRGSMISVKSRGGLSTPSTGLLKLITIAENSTMSVVSKSAIHIDTLCDIVSQVENYEEIPLIGCLEHQQIFTQALLKYYLIMRMHFLCKRENEIGALKANKTRELRKLSKL